MAGDATIEAKRAAHSSWVGWLGRLGLAARGISYCLVGLIAIRVAVGGRGNTEDRPGALRALQDEPLGEPMLIGLALGFGAYALWRFAQGFLDRDDEGKSIEGLGKRAGFIVRGLVYGGLVVSTVSVLIGQGEGGSGKEDKATAGVLDAPAGRYLVIAIGVTVAGVGAYNVYRALTAKFRKRLRAMGDAPEAAAIALGVAGHLARGLVFGIAGWFLIKAAVEYEPKKAVGLDGALAKLAQQDYGPWLLGFTAAGLFAYGLYSLFEARYRRV